MYLGSFEDGCCCKVVVISSEYVPIPSDLLFRLVLSHGETCIVLCCLYAVGLLAQREFNSVAVEKESKEVEKC